MVRISSCVYHRHTNDELMTTTKQVQTALALLPYSLSRSCCALEAAARVLYMPGRRMKTSMRSGSPWMTTENDEATCTKVLGWCPAKRFHRGVTFFAGTRGWCFRDPGAELTKCPHHSNT